MLSDTYNNNLSLSVAKTNIISGRTLTLCNCPQRIHCSTVSPLHAAALSHSTRPISKTVGPICQLDIKTGENRVQIEKKMKLPFNIKSSSYDNSSIRVMKDRSSLCAATSSAPLKITRGLVTHGLY